MSEIRRLSLSRGLVPIVLSLWLTACAGMTQRKDVEAVEQIKKVAIVALSVDQPDREGGLFSARAGNLFVESKHVDRVYRELAAALTQQIGWKVVPLDQVRASEAMKAIFHDTMDGFQNKQPPGAKINRNYAPGIPDIDGMRIMRPEGRQRLAKALGVDAVVAMSVRANTVGFSVMGLGANPHIESLAALHVYRGAEEAPIWFESFSGEKTEESVSLSANQADIDRIVIESAKIVFKKIKR